MYDNDSSNGHRIYNDHENHIMMMIVISSDDNSHNKNNNNNNNTNYDHNVYIHCIYIYNHPGVDRIWDFQPFSHSRKEFWTSPYSIYSRLTTYRERYIYRWADNDKT